MRKTLEPEKIYKLGLLYYKWFQASFLLSQFKGQIECIPLSKSKNQAKPNGLAQLVQPEVCSLKITSSSVRPDVCGLLVVAGIQDLLNYLVLDDKLDNWGSLLSKK